MNIVVGEAARAAPRLFVPSRKEVPDAVVDMLVNCPVRLQAGAIAEVRRPTVSGGVDPALFGGETAGLSGGEKPERGKLGRERPGLMACSARFAFETPTMAHRELYSSDRGLG